MAGPDAIAFAQAQFTSDFIQRSTDHWELSARCNAKGRTLEVILSRVISHEVELIVPAEQAAEFAHALKLYSIGRRITLIDSLVVSAKLSASQTEPVLAVDAGRALSLDQPECVDDPQAGLKWRRADMRSGIAWLSANTSARFLPQALGLETRGGLSYRKGCYPGQEVIARVHYLGKAKQRLSGYRQNTPGPEARELINDQEEVAGQLIASLDDSGFRIGLAVVSSELKAGAMLRLGGQPGILIEPEAL